MAVDEGVVDDTPLGSVPIAALLRGEDVPRSLDSFRACVDALLQLELRLEDIRESRRHVTPDIHHVENLVRHGVEPVLREQITVLKPDQKVIAFYFGQVFRPYDLDFLRRTVAGVIDELPSNSAAADAVLGVLTPYLQTWVDFIIPSALGDLEAAIEKGSATVAFSPKLQQMYRDHESFRRLTSLERQAEATVRNLKKAAGEGGKERLAQTFDERGEAEAASASNWNKLVMLFVALGIGLPLFAISLEDRFLGSLPGAYGVAIKAVIGLPLFVLATYCGRISAQHRQLSQHMRTLTAQIDSVNAYVAALPAPVQQEIIVALGRRAFSEPGVAGVHDGTVGIPPEQLLPVLEKALETIKEIRK